MNREAYLQLRCEKRFEIVTGASHLFEETGAIDRVAHLALTWFGHYVRRKADEGVPLRTAERRLVFEAASHLASAPPVVSTAQRRQPGN
jgi:hypothetical protein